jgi:hypothetical protein
VLFLGHVIKNKVSRISAMYSCPNPFLIHITIYNCILNALDNVATVHAMKIYRWGRDIAPLILNPGTRRR